MKIILAISGGVDSMVMLEIMAYHHAAEVRQQADSLREYGCARPRIVVASFDHGTRPSGADDVQFVRKKCGEFGLFGFGGESNLGANASEELAREKRYEFLRNLAANLRKPGAMIAVRRDYDERKLSPEDAEITMIYTAHHLDDLVETVAINLLRGTGWRGLAALDAPDICRPFLTPELMPESLRNLVPFDKETIFSYAAAFDIAFREDPTNSSDAYLRNRLRHRMNNFSNDSDNASAKKLSHGTHNSPKLSRAQKLEIYQLWQRQKKLKHEIDRLIAEILPSRGEKWQRSWFQNLDANLALELLRAGTLRAGIHATRPQLADFRQAILSYAPGKKFNLPGDALVKFTKGTFEL